MSRQHEQSGLHSHRRCIHALGLTLSVIFSSAAGAQEAAKLEEVTVTAQKRTERLEDVPIADSAITATDALNRGITDMSSLQMAVPGLVINHTANEGNIFIRGVGTNLFGPASEQTVAVYVDGVYLPSPEANLFSFNNIERIEVLKGPQGTLFGRNTTGGVVQIITRDPSQVFGGDVSVGYANYDDVTAQGYVTGGLTQSLSADLAVMYENQGIGWGHNFTTGQQNGITARAITLCAPSGKFTPLDSTTVKLILDYSRQYSKYDYQLLPGIVSPLDGKSTYPGRYNALGGLNDFELVKQRGASLEVEHDAGVVRLVNILAYRRSAVGVCAGPGRYTGGRRGLVATIPGAQLVRGIADLQPRLFTHQVDAGRILLRCVCRLYAGGYQRRRGSHRRPPDNPLEGRVRPGYRSNNRWNQSDGRCPLHFREPTLCGDYVRGRHGPGHVSGLPDFLKKPRGASRWTITSTMT